VEILDLPELNRKKLIKLPEQKEDNKVNITKDGYFVLSPTITPQTQVQEVIQPKIKEESAPATNFLSDFASIGANEPQKTPEVKENNIEVKDLKWRLENLEFKLEQLIEKVNSINRE
jgi:hypothetical protein